MKQSLTTKIAIGMVLGIIAGWQFPEFSILISPIGEIFMRLLKMLIVPLVLFSMTTGAISALKSGKSQAKKLALKTFGYYLLTTFFAVIFIFLLPCLLGYRFTHTTTLDTARSSGGRRRAPSRTPHVPAATGASLPRGCLVPRPGPP